MIWDILSYTLHSRPMSYHVTILRTANGKAVPIELEAAVATAGMLEGWRYVAQDRSFHMQRGEDALALWYQDGELWTSNPEEWALDAMIAFAKPLEARVRGDEFETYETAARTYEHPDDLTSRRDSQRESKALLAASLREQRMIRRGIVGFFVALGTAGFFIGRSFERK